ncbi:MAG: TlpA disulfide reductase family protein [Pseudomonadota bacterium]
MSAHRPLTVAAFALSAAAAIGQPIVAAGGPPVLSAAAARTGSAQLPEIELDDGSRYLERSARGKVLVVNFWASWCGPCREELPSLDRLAARRRDIVVIAASVDADRNDARTAFAGQYPHLHLGFSPIAQVRRYGALGTPYSVIFDRSGREVARVPRAIDWGGAQAIAMLKRGR